MKTTFTRLLLIPLTGLALSATAQNGPYQIRASAEFESPKRHRVMNPIAYGKDGIVQINAKGEESFNFQLFSNDLKMQRENTVSTEGKLGDRVNYDRFLKFRNKTYLFVREVFRDIEAEGISALEFNPKNLDFQGTSKNLFKSSGPVQVWTYDFDMSEDKTRFMYSYKLRAREKKDKINKDIVGIHVFDENLVKLWGGEFEMPYTEAIMDNLGYTVTDDGKVFLLARVFDDENRRAATADKTPNYHYEALVYSKNSSQPKVISIKLNDLFLEEAYVYEDKNHSVFVTGFYSKAVRKPTDGAYVLELNADKGLAQRVEGGGTYEFPSELIKAYTSDREKRKLEKKESKDPGGDIGIDNLKIRDIYVLEDGSKIIVSEQYHVETHTYYNGRTTTTTYDTYANDVFLMSIGSKGNLQWVQKIPKAQHSNDAVGRGLSINTYVTGNKLHLFFIDNLKNYNLPPTEAPKVHQDGRGGFITAVQVDSKGNFIKYNLGEVESYETNFFIRDFIDGGNNNLINTERKRRENTLISIDIR